MGFLAAIDFYFIKPPSPAQPDQFFNVFGWGTERRASHMRLRQWREAFYARSR
jgi:hypothetical protein